MLFLSQIISITNVKYLTLRILKTQKNMMETIKITEKSLLSHSTLKVLSSTHQF